MSFLSIKVLVGEDIICCICEQAARARRLSTHAGGRSHEQEAFMGQLHTGRRLKA